VTTANRPCPSVDIRAYDRWVRRQKGYGRWQPFVDAQPARDHVQQVMATTGIGWRRYADQAGVPRATLTYLLYGNNGRRAKRITPTTETKLLALHADSAHTVTVPAIGAHRRIHVLMGEGWPQIHLGPHFGTHPQYVSQILQNDRITIATAEAVASAYEALHGVDPLTAGATAHGVTLAKRAAARNNWPDRTFWDDMGGIDDPDFDPDAAETMTEHESKKVRRQEIIHLARYGCSPEEINTRLGGELTLRYVRDVVTEVRTGHKRDRRKQVVA
jgi:hypothetical protein